jgi:hypothetical protein
LPLKFGGLTLPPRRLEQLVLSQNFLELELLKRAIITQNTAKLG